jgi:hypothetical protein
VYQSSGIALNIIDVAGGIKPEELDTFHDMILIDELSRCGAGGVVWGLVGGLGIGLPPVSLLCN